MYRNTSYEMQKETSRKYNHNETSTKSLSNLGYKSKLKCGYHIPFPLPKEPSNTGDNLLLFFVQRQGRRPYTTLFFRMTVHNQCLTKCLKIQGFSFYNGFKDSRISFDTHALLLQFLCILHQIRSRLIMNDDYRQIMYLLNQFGAISIIFSTSGHFDTSITFSPSDATASIRNPCGFSNPWNPYYAAFAAASEQ